MPLFIDPFLLFNSKKAEYQKIHEDIINYLRFLKRQSENKEKLSPGMMAAWFLFSEVRQTWLGFSTEGNSGRGMGPGFARGLFEGLKTIFKSFGLETISKAPHMEKLCLISPQVGRDKISDFTTNFAKEYLLSYTETFAQRYLLPEQCQVINVPKVFFDYRTQTWMPKKFLLPFIGDDYVILTPTDMLTRDDTFINRTDMINNLHSIAPAVTDQTLRFELENYFREILGKGDEKLSRKEKNDAAEMLIRTFPELIDYYIKYKEERGDEATSISEEKVKEVYYLFNEQLSELVEKLKQESGFYEIVPNAYDEALKRVEFLKHVIEDQDGYKIFYINGQPIKKEKDLQLLFKLVWYGTVLDVNSEVNNGRGPVDFKISFGKENAALVEFKLASNTKLKDNLAKQVEVYQAASQTKRAIKVIMFFTEEEHSKLLRVLNELGLTGCPDIIEIDARGDNKPSASNVKI